MWRTRRQRGVTLIEMLGVLIIIGLVATAATLAVLPKIEKGKVDLAKGQVRTLEQAVQMFKLDHGKYPDSLNDLVQAPGWIKNPFPEGGYFENMSTIPSDPWNNAYQYSVEGSSFTITCYARDGQSGGSGLDEDITNKTLRK